MAELATDVALFIATVKAAHPGVQIGQYELYPEMATDQIKDYIKALQAAGATLAFFHLDVHGQRLDQYQGWGLPVSLEADLPELRDFFATRRIPFGVILTDPRWQPRYSSGYTDEVYRKYTMEFVQKVYRAMGQPVEAVFQSWVWGAAGENSQRITPTNMPDSGAGWGHTELVLEGLEVLEAD